MDGTGQEPSAEQRTTGGEPSAEQQRPSGQEQQPATPEPSAEQQLEELRDAVLDDWILVTSHATDAIRSMQATVSWRVTRPLRTFRVLSYKAKDIGLVPTGQLAAVAIARRLRGRG